MIFCFLQFENLRGSGNPHFINVKNNAYVVYFFSGTIYNRGLKFIQAIYETLNCDLTQGFLYLISIIEMIVFITYIFVKQKFGIMKGKSSIY